MDTRQKAAFFSVISNIGIVILKIIVGLATNSISIISEAIHSVMDLVSALIAYFTVGKSSQPADRTHPYGHGKFENLSGTIEAVLIGAAGIYIIEESIERLITPKPLDLVGYGLGVMAVSALVNLFVYRHNIKVARAAESVALEANAAHLIADMYTSIGVFAGLGLIYITGFEAVDSVAAIFVAVFILKTAIQLTWKALRDLTDWGLPEDEQNAIHAILQDHYTQYVEYHELRTRKSGAERYIDLHLVLARNMDLQTAHDLCDHLEEDINHRFPRSHTIIHIEPETTLWRDGKAQANVFSHRKH